MECPDLVLGDNIRKKTETCTNDHKCNCVVTFECDSGKFNYDYFFVSQS